MVPGLCRVLSGGVLLLMGVHYGHFVSLEDLSAMIGEYAHHVCVVGIVSKLFKPLLRPIKGLLEEMLGISERVVCQRVGIRQLPALLNLLHEYSS